MGRQGGLGALGRDEGMAMTTMENLIGTEDSKGKTVLEYDYEKKTVKIH